MTVAPLLDVIVAVHTTTRPVERTVASALADESLAVRVTVVAHNLASVELAPRLGEISDPRLRVVEHADGIASPAGPMNAGMRAATAPTVTVIGSDDYYEPGALAAAMVRVRRGADVAILPIRSEGGARIPTPLPRWGRTARLDAVRDRLFTRTAPLALIDRHLMLAHGDPFTEGLSSGEDLAVSTRIWTTARRIDYVPAAPAYVIGGGAADRVTAAPRPLAEELRAVSLLLSNGALAELPLSVRRSLAVKLVRVHIFGAVTRRRTDEPAADDRALLGRMTGELAAFAPGFDAPLSRAERVLWGTLADERPWSEIVDRDEARETGRWRDRVLTDRLSASLRTDAVLRRYLQYRLTPRGTR